MLSTQGYGTGGQVATYGYGGFSGGVFVASLIAIGTASTILRNMASSCVRVIASGTERVTGSFTSRRIKSDVNDG